ncbi:occludin [Parabacteroides pacaensis]|uniref:occludin n=1 Tax=Parabacteroides pacaensis TaxID=2086575 RepID=UPI000D0EAE39|nr:occludin [Parabacteroides pacaensis]
MKKLILLFFIWILATAVSAQTENGTENKEDSLSIEKLKGLDKASVDLSFIRMPDFRTRYIPQFLPAPMLDYKKAFQINTKSSFTQISTPIFSPIFFGLGYNWGILSTPQSLQMGSFKLNNSLRINLYGDYNADGWKVNNPSALPWEKNNFRGAFEIKSDNGAFGFRIGVQRGTSYPY